MRSPNLPENRFEWGLWIFLHLAFLIAACLLIRLIFGIPFPWEAK